MPGAPFARSSEPTEVPPRPTLAGNTALGVTQIVLWGGTFFLTAVVSDPVVAETGWPQAMVVGALSLAIFVSGLPAPFVGRMIRRHGGRPVLVIGATIIAAGLVLMAVAQTLPVFLLAWVVAGLGMSAALYDPLFAAIGQAYGPAARGAMTQIAISSGLAVSLCWPATRFLVDHVGWRGACLTYAILSVAFVAPLFAWALPARSRAAAGPTPPRPAGPAGSAEAARLPAERLLAVTFTMAAMIMTAASVQLLNLLQTLGVGGTAAVALTGLIGPAQVGVRVVELAFGRRAHPAWALLLSSASVGLGLLLLATLPSLAWLAMLLYGAGNGMRTVVRGTLPLALYGQREYAAAMGRLARLPLLGQAVTPLACGYIAERFGLMPLLDVMLAVAAINLGLSLWVFGFAMRRPNEQA
ncbi:MFS transporter [Methylobacterium organophilum]|nr:MFS transporter [Methylobacterium organophilum]OXE43220.1 MFS transporter [Methylobacterium radiotolerans]GAN46579.1 major facilitator transporter [Methylobacterium sp. ME121]